MEKKKAKDIYIIKKASFLLPSCYAQAESFHYTT